MILLIHLMKKIFSHNLTLSFCIMMVHNMFMKKIFSHNLTLSFCFMMVHNMFQSYI
jgi:hypothetical protein